MNSYAKINLRLEILGNREDGYHEIKTLFHQIDLCDELSFTESDDIKITWLPDPHSHDSRTHALTHSRLTSHVSPPPLRDNTVFKTASLMKKRYSVSRGVDVAIKKRIPVSAGLGGGSSNAAATIVSLSSLWGLDLDEAEMNSIAAEIGSDVPFFLYGGTACGEGRGELITGREDIFLKRILLVKPGFGISSKEAYTLFRTTLHVPSKNGQNNVPKYGQNTVLSLQKESPFFNQLEAPIRKKYREIDAIIGFLADNGAEHSFLSGSGSTVIGIYNSDKMFNEHYDIYKRKGYWTCKTNSHEKLGVRCKT